MELEYGRCRDDDPRYVVSKQVGVALDGSVIEVGLAEWASASAIDGALETVTLAIKNGVVGDFQLRTALALAGRRVDDPHAICPVVGILAGTWALLGGARIQTAKGGGLQLEIGDDTPEWVRVLIGKLETPE